MLGEAPIEPLKLTQGDTVNIKFVTDNIEQVELVTIYAGFDEMETISQAPFDFNFTPTQTGR